MKSDESNKLVTVFASHNRPTIAFAKSLLDGANIYYYCKNEIISETFGSGVFSKLDTCLDPIELQVLKSDEKIAKEILKDIISK